MKRLARLVPLLACLVLAASCSSINNDMVDENHKAAKSLIRAAAAELDPGYNMIAASFANIDNLHTSSSFGRIASQQIVSEFTAQGYDFVDILLRRNIYVREGDGEFLLSREIEAISADYQAGVVLVGTYAVGDRQVFITAKLIRTHDGVIIASHDYAVPYRGEARALITGETGDGRAYWEQWLGM